VRRERERERGRERERERERERRERGSRATESIEFRPAPRVTRQTNGEHDRAGWQTGCVAVLNRVYRITARFISIPGCGQRAPS